MGAASYGVMSWVKLLETVARAVLFDVRYREKALRILAELGSTSKKGTLRHPMELENGLWLEGNRAADDIIRRVLRLLVACGYPLESAVVEYESSPHKATKLRKEKRQRNVGMQPIEAFQPRNGEKAGAFARRMFTKMLEEGHIPREDFLACLDDKDGTKRVFGLLPGGQPLFSRKPMKVGGNHRSWVQPFQSRFGFPVYVNSQWRPKHLGKLATLFATWSGKDKSMDFFPVSPIQTTLFGPPAPEQLSLFSASGRKITSRPTETPEKIGSFAKRELYAALAEGRVPDEDFNQLRTSEGTIDLLGISLSRCPLFALRPIVRDSKTRSWADPAHRNGQAIYVCQEWYERHRSKLKELLSRWRSSTKGAPPKKKEKIGIFAKREIYSALFEGRVPDSDFQALSTATGTKSLLGLPLKGCPLFSQHAVRQGTHLRTWSDPAKRNGYPVFVCKEWFDYPNDGEKLNKLLSRWKKKSMIEQKDLPTQIEEFYDNIFTSDDFLEYAAEIYGLGTTPAAKAAQIRCLVQRFIRLNRDHWISVSAFRKYSDWNPEKETSISEVLNSLLGEQAFLPFALLPEDVFSMLPAIRLNGNLLSWNRELLASIAALLIPSVHVTNHGIAPQSLTALLVPTSVPDDDVIGMVLASYCKLYPGSTSINKAFAFLHDHFVRSRLSDKLKREIRKFLMAHSGEGAMVQVENHVELAESGPTPDHSDDNEKLLDAWAEGVF